MSNEMQAVPAEPSVNEKIIQLAMDIDNAIAPSSPSYEVLFNALARVASAYCMDYVMATKGELQAQELAATLDHFCVATRGVGMEIMAQLEARAAAQTQEQEA